MRWLAFEVISQSETKSPKKINKQKKRGEGGSPNYFFDWNPNIFGSKKPIQLEPYDNPFWCFEQRYQEQQERKRKEKNEYLK
jgi:hypothetical protein